MAYTFRFRFLHTHQEGMETICSRATAGVTGTKTSHRSISGSSPVSRNSTTKCEACRSRSLRRCLKASLLGGLWQAEHSFSPATCMSSLGRLVHLTPGLYVTQPQFRGPRAFVRAFFSTKTGRPYTGADCPMRTARLSRGNFTECS